MDDDDYSNFLVSCGLIIAGVELAEEFGTSRRRRYRVNPYLTERHIRGRFITDFENLKNSPELFIENFRMSPTVFDELFTLVEPYIRRKRNTRPHDYIPEKAKLAIVIEYMASGDVQRHISSCYRISKQHLSRIIEKVCNGIRMALKDEIPPWNIETLAEVASGFHQKWNFPNCVGAIDGKHISIRAPPKSGTIFYNYKGFHSIVMMAVCDADYRFTYLDVGAYGSEGDAGIFLNSNFGKSILQDTSPFPADAFVGQSKIPFFLVGDDAFPLTKHIMKPFSKRELSTEERIFNYRLSRARRCIENAFGILSSRWLCLRKVLFCSPDHAQSITTACCLLHNFLMNKNRQSYCSETFLGKETNGIWVDGVWQTQAATDKEDLTAFCTRRGRTAEYGKHVRNVLLEYVNSTEGSVPWQNNAAFL